MGKRNLLYLSEVAAGPVDPAVLAKTWSIYSATSIKEACEIASESNFRVGLLVLNGGTSTPAAYEELILASPRTAWVAALPQEGLLRSDYRHLIGQGFFDFHTLPVNYPLLNAQLGHAFGMARLKDPILPPEQCNSDYQIVGDGPVIQKTLRHIEKMATANAPVLIRGESGTGKELAARAVHRQSARRQQVFVTINCGALPSSLIQSELFGYERGAFTGANRRKIGRIEAANEGTLFLDEIGDLPLDLQANLLRFLEEQTIERIGGHESVQVDVRVVTATHVNLEKAVAEGRFREDLYYRLNVLNLTMPPLRDRIEDIEPLARYYFDRFSNERNLSVKGFSHQATSIMRQHGWPGNVRELVNRVRRAMVMCERRLITPIELGLDHHTVRQTQSLHEARDSAEKDVIKTCLRQNNNNISITAKSLGVSRLTLYRLLDKHNLRE